MLSLGVKLDIDPLNPLNPLNPVIKPYKPEKTLNLPSSRCPPCASPPPGDASPPRGAFAPSPRGALLSLFLLGCFMV